MANEKRFPSVPREFRTLPDNPTFEDLAVAYAEMAKAYANVAHGYTSNWPRIMSRLDEIESDIAGVAAMAHAALQLESRITVLEEAMLMPRSKVGPRAEARSSADLARHLGAEIARRYEEEMRDSSTPTTVPPPKVADMVTERVQIELVKLRAATLQKAEDVRRDQEELARREKREDKRIIRRNAWIAGITFALGVVSTLIAHFAH